jgi:hypothetical protein
MATVTAPLQRLRRTKQSRGQAPEVNLGEAERLVSTLGGSALALYGLTRRSLGGLALAVAGGALVYRGLTGYCPVCRAFRDARGAKAAVPQGSAAPAAPPDGLTPEEHAEAERLAKQYALERGGGQLPPYDKAQADEDFKRAAAEVLRRRRDDVRG